MPDKRTIRILVIDDDAEFREQMRMQLEVAGYAAEVAEDAVEGGKAILAHPPDLVLCDIRMPHLNGLDLLALMRTEERCASIPVIFVSGFGDNATIAKAVDLGGADFLSKPIAHADLIASIEACLKAGGRKAISSDDDLPPVV
jgi:two-component system, sensor histidine kinase and response regulator